ncbi:MAG: S8 family serine peptidase [Chloroflexota bacterium]|nr:S8 family serine peptidase [Chloroflexota bacterium]
MKRTVLILMVMLIASGLMASILLLASGPAVTQASPVHPAVLASLEEASDGTVGFFVLMKDQADLSFADQIDDWQAKGRWVQGQLQTTADSSQSELAQVLTRERSTGHIDQWQRFWIVNTLWVEGDRYAVEALARQPGVAHILPPMKLELPAVEDAPGFEREPDQIPWNLQQINADDVWDLGYDGEGIVVGVLDTGVEYDHPALIRQYRGSNGNGPPVHDYNWYDPYWDTGFPQPLPVTSTVTPGDLRPYHGTHVTGILVGREQDGSHQIGVAPGARWMSAYGCCPDNDTLLEALQWFVAPTRRDGSGADPAKRPHVLQNSWGGTGGSTIFAQAMATIKAAGIFVSVSAGNFGEDGCATLASPGDNPGVFSVGGTGISGNMDTMYPLSSRGPNPFTGSIGPDVVAPGDSIVSSWPGSTDYHALSGTSMAAPHVAGAVALLWQANQALIGKVDHTAELLRKTAEPVIHAGQVCGGVDSGNQHPNNTAGWGRLDVLRALELAGRGDGSLTVRVTDEQGHSLDDAMVSLARSISGLGQVALDGQAVNGEYQFIVAPGLATVSAERFGYESDSAFVMVNTYSSVTIVLRRSPQFSVQGVVWSELPFKMYVPAILSGGDGRGIARSASSGRRQPDDAHGLEATVTVLDSPLPPVMTDCSGAFNLMLPEGSHRLLVEALGYEPQTITMVVDGPETLAVALQPAWDYRMEDSRDGSVAYNWIEASGGTAYSLRDDDRAEISLPQGRSFRFYGQEYGIVYVLSNGIVNFGVPALRYQGVIPFEGQPNNAIYALGEDLNPRAREQYSTTYNNRIYVLDTGNRMVIQYDEVEHWSTGHPETFQVILEYATAEITLQYQKVSWPDHTTVGVENETGNRAVVYSRDNSAHLTNGRAVRFTPVFGQPPQSCGQ